MGFINLILGLNWLLYVIWHDFIISRFITWLWVLNRLIRITLGRNDVRLAEFYWIYVFWDSIVVNWLKKRGRCKGWDMFLGPKTQAPHPIPSLQAISTKPSTRERERERERGEGDVADDVGGWCSKGCRGRCQWSMQPRVDAAAGGDWARALTPPPPPPALVAQSRSGNWLWWGRKERGKDRKDRLVGTKIEEEEGNKTPTRPASISPN